MNWCEFRINFLFHKETYPYYTKFHCIVIFLYLILRLISINKFRVGNFQFYFFFSFFLFVGQKSKSLSFHSIEKEKNSWKGEQGFSSGGSDQFHCLQFPRVLGTFGRRGQHPFSGSASENTNGHTPPKLFPSTGRLLWMCTPTTLVEPL